MSNLELLEQRIAQQAERLKALKAKKQAIEARERAKAQKLSRQQETRRKILLGSLMLKMMEDSEQTREGILKRLDGYLTRGDDRELFDLPGSGS